MNELKIFEDLEFGKIRIIEHEGKPLAVGVDVARCLQYSNPSKAVLDHCKGISKLGIPSEGGIQETYVIPEGDIYRLIFKAADQSRNPDIKFKAQRFERWIFDEILPSICKTGGYVNNEDQFVENYLSFADESTKNLFKVSLSAIREQNSIINQQQEQIKLNAPKIDFYDKFLDSTGLINLLQAASTFGITIQKFNKALTDSKILYKRGTHKFVAQKYLDAGYFKTKITLYSGENHPQIFITPKGMNFIQDKII
jgi:prophage antirepressor-like protein